MGFERFKPEKNLPKVVYGPPAWFRNKGKEDAGSDDPLLNTTESVAKETANTNGDKKDE